MLHPGNIERPRLPYDPAHYDKWADRAEHILPIIGGYDYQIEEYMDTDGAAIVSPKHTSMMDVPLIGTMVRQVYGRHLRAPAKRELYEYPIVGKVIGDFFDKGGGIKLDRKVPITNQAAGEQIEQAITSGDWVEIFAEGTRVRSHRVGEINGGLALLAMRHLVPIQAVGVAGTRHYFGRKYGVFGRVINVDPDQFSWEDRRSYLPYARNITNEVHQAMQDANDQAWQQRAKMQVFIPLIRKAVRPNIQPQ